MNSRQIIIRDETLRDGAQQYGINLKNSERLEISYLSATLLNSIKSKRYNQIDLGMPEVSISQMDSVREISHELKSHNIDFFVTGRATKESIEAMCEPFSSIEKNRYIIAPFIGISKQHRFKLGMTKKDILRKIVESVKIAKKYTKRIHFPLEGAYLSFVEDREYVYNIFRILTDYKVESAPFCDTSGVALPFSWGNYLSYGDAIGLLRNKFPNVEISVHCHNDLGLAVANSVNGLINGANTVDGTYLGIGERAGNAQLEVLIVLLDEFGKNLGLEINTDIKKLYRTVLRIGKIMNISIPDHTSVIGKNVFTHASGIHQDGTLKDDKIYQAFDPRKIGRNGHKIELSYLSGKNGIKHILEKKYQIVLDKKQLAQVTIEFKKLGGLRTNPDVDLLRLVKSIKHD